MQRSYTLTALIVALTIATTGSAQSWGFSNYGHWGEDISIADDGSVWMVGLGGEDPMWLDFAGDYVVKLNADGEKQFGVHTELTGAPYYYAQSALPTADGGAVIYAAVGYAEAWLYKLDAAGTKIWESGPLGTDGYMYGGKAVRLNDGRIIIGGLADFEHIFYEVDEAGVLLSTWSVEPDTGAAWGWSYYDYKDAGMVATADGGFAYACGNQGNRIVMKFNSDLSEDWTGYYPWELPWEYGFHNTLSQTADGGYLLAGSSTDVDFGYMGTLRRIDGDGNLLWMTTYNHGSDIEEGSHAVELGSGDIVVWTQNEGDQSSAGWITDPVTGMEIGSIEIPVLGAVDPIGGMVYNGIEINNVEPAADGGYYFTGRMYLENFDQRMVVLKSNADGTFGPCIFDCVWPGDANNDGYATGDDLFEIGINYGAEGATRDDMTIDWSPKLAQMWMEPDTAYWFIFNDLKFTDCNGSGVINDDDTTAVVNNLGLEHPLNPARMGAGDVPLYFDPADTYLHIGLNEIPIMLGDELNTVDAIYGLSFTINVEGENIDAAALKVTWDESWIGSLGETLSLSKTFGDTKQVVGSIVRKTRTNTSGDGQVGTLQIVVVDNISGKTDFTDVEISFGYANAVMLNREVIPLAPETLNITAEENTGIMDDEASLVSISPNPATELLYFNFGNAQAQQIRITDMSGHLVMQANNADVWMNGLDVHALAVGNYIVECVFSDRVDTATFAKQ